MSWGPKHWGTISEMGKALYSGVQCIHVIVTWTPPRTDRHDCNIPWCLVIKTFLLKLCYVLVICLGVYQINILVSLLDNYASRNIIFLSSPLSCSTLLPQPYRWIQPGIYFKCQYNGSGINQFIIPQPLTLTSIRLLNQ